MSEKNLGSHISPERMGRFTWHEGDLKFFKTEEDFLKYAEKNNMTVIRYGNFKGGEQMKKTALYGAILGDIIGAPFEFDRDVDGVKKTKNFKLFNRKSEFTDDSVMTIAVAEALLSVEKNADEETVCDAVINSMRKWGKKYPYAGYGSGFFKWLKSDNPKPYNSWGNGSAMRVSAVGWLYDTLERTREVARWTAQVSHNHLEGIKGAESTVSAIFLARNGATKDEIKKYLETEFGYNLNRTLDEIRPNYYHIESCQETVPEAVIAFLESTDFEDAIRNGVSLGGDADTLTCITGSIAEAFYGVPQNLSDECRKRIDAEMLEVLDKFNAVLNKKAIDLATINADLLKIINGFQNDVPVPSDWIYLGNDDVRYVLGQLGKKNLLIFGINPSSATPVKTDKTIQSVRRIAPAKGYDGWIMMNLHPQRSTDPSVLQPDEILLDNNLKVVDFIKKTFSISDIWCAWGDAIDDFPQVKDFLYKSLHEIYFSFDNSVHWFHYGTLTKAENPRHPLYKTTTESFEKFLVMRSLNKKIAQETLKVTEQGFYEKDGKKINLVGKNFDAVIAISPTDSDALIKNFSAPTENVPAKISVLDCDTFSACNSDKKFLAMNFANAHYPGGGFLNGANAQEEALCRESTLYKSLSSLTAQKMYDYNHIHDEDCYSDYMTISPNVCVFRNIKDNFLDVPFTTSVITVPAPNRNGAAKNVPQEKLDEIMKNRLRKMFAVATHYGYKNLVLGAWGCGAFGHNPHTVAKYFHELLFDESYRYAFNEIIFAIYDRGEKKNYHAFDETFS